MERIPKPQESTNKQEIIPLGQARFIDRLAPEYEQQWSELLQKAYETKLSFEETLFPIWLDESFPQVIRDRVMLLSMGKQDTAEQIGGPWRSHYKGSFTRAGIGPKHREGYQQAYSRWIDEAVEYGDVINHSTLFRHAYTKFEAGEWSQEKFERILEWFNPILVQPMMYGGDWYDEGTQLDLSRLPYIDDILAEVTTSEPDTRLKAWAQEKLDLYRQNYMINETVLPSWLQNLGARTILRFTAIEYGKFDQDEKLSPNLLKTLEIYGFQHDYLHRNDFRKHSASFLARLDELPQAVIVQYATFRYKGALSGRHNFSKGEEDLIVSHIADPLPQGIADLRTKLRDMYAQIEKENAESYQKFEDERNTRLQREARQAKLTEKAMNRYTEKMNTFRIEKE